LSPPEGRHRIRTSSAHHRHPFFFLIQQVNQSRYALLHSNCILVTFQIYPVAFMLHTFVHPITFCHRVTFRWHSTASRNTRVTQCTCSAECACVVEFTRVACYACFTEVAYVTCRTVHRCLPSPKASTGGCRAPNRKQTAQEGTPKHTGGTHDQRVQSGIPRNRHHLHRHISRQMTLWGGLDGEYPNHVPHGGS
jgi:hypothetical protein